MLTSLYERFFSKWKRASLFSLAVIFLAQVNINLFVTDFRISIGIFLFPVLLFLSDDFPILKVTFLSGVGVILSRSFLSWLQLGNTVHIFQNSFPEVLFYITYGCLLFTYYRYKHSTLDKNRAFIPLLIMDYCANLVELLYRLHFDAFTFKTQFSILLVAFIRTILIWSIITAIDSYGFALINKEHAERYKMLLLLISRLKSEVLWMQKNTTLIEHTMHTSYQLFDEMKTQQVDESLSKSALSVAKDIHEIKKEYMLIMRGISEALNEDLRDEGMYLHEMLGVLEDVHLREAKTLGKHLVIEIQCDKNIYTTKQYSLMSVFNNLFTNALEASITEPIRLVIQQETLVDTYQFSVTDFGKGIPEDTMIHIFSPGFSTKINYTTGEVNRGLGLNLVKDIIEREFHGRVWAESKQGQTTFYIQLLKTELEDSHNETISH
ncbi:sensor histidine kinase [Lachnospiraceae bacterium LCP25S3_G4]